MSNPYTDRLNEVSRLRKYRQVIEQQIGDEIAKAWRLSPASNLGAFAQTLGMELEEVQAILSVRGIVVRIQPTIPGTEI